MHRIDAEDTMGRNVMPRRWPPLVVVAAILLAATIAASVRILGGIPASRYFCAVLLATTAGLPLGFALFGRRHAAGWVAGICFGYLSTALVCWSIAALGGRSSAAYSAGWCGAAAAIALVTFTIRPASAPPVVVLPDWTRRDTAALLLVLLLVPALVTRPFSRIGSADGEGNQRYRAYFTADFVWHMALVAELKRHEYPLRNPYLASQPIHYYWLYFVVPAVAGPIARTDTAHSLEVNALATSLLFLSAIYLFAWLCVPHKPGAVAAAVCLIVVAASPEGVAAIIYVLSRGEPLTEIRNMNVDALSRGLGGLRIDGLPRALWYTPQHAMSYAAGLIGLFAVVRQATELRWPAITLSATALAGSVLLNPFVGAMFCGVYAMTVVADVLFTGGGIDIRAVARHTVAILPVVGALTWIYANRIASGVGSALHFGLFGPAASAPVASLLLSLGPGLALAIAGLWPYRRVAWRPIVPAAIGVVVSLLVMHIVTMTVDLFWIGFRMGHLFLVFAPALAARAVVAIEGFGLRATAAVATAILLIGAPTTVIDAFNAQDVNNDRMAAGFHWTVKITPAEQEALTWIRLHTLPDAIVQAEPMIRGRESWSLIPSFAERRMAGGQPISLMHVPEYDDASTRVREIYSTPDVARAWRLATDLGIDYLYIDATERTAYVGIKKFDHAPDLFPPAFHNGEVLIVAVSHVGR